VTIFLGKYTMFDNDKLLDLLMDILGMKFKDTPLTEEQIFDKLWLEDQKEKQLYVSRPKV
jgi:hypothetical protein